MFLRDPRSAASSPWPPQHAAASLSHAERSPPLTSTDTGSRGTQMARREEATSGRWESTISWGSERREYRWGDVKAPRTVMDAQSWIVRRALKLTPACSLRTASRSMHRTVQPGASGRTGMRVESWPGEGESGAGLL